LAKLALKLELVDSGQVAYIESERWREAGRHPFFDSDTFKTLKLASVSGQPVRGA
jgi:hypothetical protein